MGCTQDSLILGQKESCSGNDHITQQKWSQDTSNPSIPWWMSRMVLINSMVPLYCKLALFITLVFLRNYCLPVSEDFLLQETIMHNWSINFPEVQIKPWL